MELNIVLAGDCQCSYTTRDCINGHVGLRFDENTIVDQFRISLLGRASVRLKNRQLKPTFKRYVQGDHSFLKISQPIEPKDLPHHGVACRGKEYAIPFSFSMPEKLLPYACSCGAERCHAGDDGHLSLPPSTSGYGMAGSVFHKLLELKEAQVTYTVDFQFRIHFSDGTSRVIKKAKKMWFVPSVFEPSPAKSKRDSVDNSTSNNGLANHFGSTVSNFLGRFGTSIAEPLEVELLVPWEGVRWSPMISIPVQLQFIPSTTNNPPPEITEVTMRISSTVSWGTAPGERGPGQGRCSPLEYHSTKTICTKKISLKGLAWTRSAYIPLCSQEPDQTDTAKVDFTLPAHSLPNSGSETRLVYTTAFRLPLYLSEISKGVQDELLIPTFNSCTTSMGYGLELSFSYRSDPSQGKFERQSRLAVEAPLRVRYQKRSSQLGPAEVLDARVDEFGSKSVEMSLEAPPAYTPVSR